MKKIILLFLLLFPFCNVSAQELTTDFVLVDSLELIDVEKIRLPPVQVFLDAAKEYTEVKYLKEKIREQELMLKISRKDWLKYFRLQGNYQYGTNSAYVLEMDGQIPGGVGVSSLNTQNWYNVGAVVSIPFDDIFTRKNKNDVVRTRIRQVEYESEKAQEDRQILILEAYNEVIKNLAILKVKAESVALYNAQMKISENDFVNGRIDIISLSLERSRRAGAIVSYQESRAALHNAVTILEMLTKVKIINNY